MSGHIRRRGTNSWEIKFDLGTDPATGRRATRYHSFKGTKREAQAELTRLLSSRDTGAYVDPSKLTVAEFLDRWERDWAEINVGPKTFERYSELLRKHVRPHIGATALQRLRVVDLNELYAKLLREGRGEKRGLAPRTVGHVHRVLHRALGHAAGWSLVQQNVASLVSPPAVASTELSILTEQQIPKVIEHVRGLSLCPIVVLALATGMRRGELLALRWRDVDLSAAKVRVERALEQTRKGGLRFKAPKTKHGRRAISIPPSVVAELKTHRAEEQKRRLALGGGKVPEDGLVFPNWDGSTRTPDTATKEFARAMGACGLPDIGLHSLRHTHASQLIASGLDVLTISRRLGHGSPAITLSVYGHLFANTDDRAAEVMERTLGNVRGT
ncbi:MAG: site-specific integrase [Hyphomicrobiales bacterium]|nr:site-specific integrase [Hyphomicrobiales bacterium]